MRAPYLKDSDTSVPPVSSHLALPVKVKAPQLGKQALATLGTLHPQTLDQVPVTRFVVVEEQTLHVRKVGTK